MKKIGLVGGLTWFSTLEYYKNINQLVNQRLGSHHSACILLESLDEEKFLNLLERDPNEKLCEKMMVDAVNVLCGGGAEIIALCANGLHRFESAIKESCNVSVEHIADATAKEISQYGIQEVGLLGVLKTMEGEFYKNRLKIHGINVLVPELPDRHIIHNKIITELTIGKFLDETRNEFNDISMKLFNKGAKGIILGCTEIPLLMKNTDSLPFPKFSTTEIHCQAIVNSALDDR